MTSGALSDPVIVKSVATAAPASPPFPPAPALPPARPTIAQALEAGVLIVVSTVSQRMEVFHDGAPWLSAPVSTGRAGHRTPAGVFPLLEKRRFHRSNLYSNAPMPFMQRLTRGGIAIHAGRLPGYPASHGCIRLPTSAAGALFALTRPGATTVVIVNQPIGSPEQARQLALAWPEPQSRAPVAQPQPRLAAPPGLLDPPIQPPAGAVQTIQLAAAPSPAEADAHWSRLLGRHAGLGRFRKSVIPVVIGARRLFRLRATGPGAFASCAQLKGAGIDCFRVF